jgi:hypothetical protein
MVNVKKSVQFLLILALTAFFCGCEDNTDKENTGTAIIPEKFKVDIPSSISYQATLKSASSDTLQGNEVYEHLKFFIAVGEGAADIVQAIMWSIKVHKIENVIELTYTSDEDGRVKHLVVDTAVSYLGKNYKYMLTITDQESEKNEDGGIGMQVFWNNAPVDGVAIIKPANLNHKDSHSGQALYRVEYSAKGTGDYEEYMVVEIADLPVVAPSIDRFGMDAIKMFAGKKGDIVDVYGNSNHPNARFFTDDTGFNWAFVASGNDTLNIGVAEVGLPPSNLDKSDRESLLDIYSIKRVFTLQINNWFYDTFQKYPDSTTIAGYLKNTDPPGYFGANGFINGGTAPNNNYTQLEGRLENLVPYNPKDITDLTIQFK